MKTLLQLAEKYQDIVVWGFGEFGKILFSDLQKNLPHKSLHVCDRNSNTIPEQVVLQPEEAYKLYPNALFVVGSDIHRKSIFAEMQKLRISNDNIFFRKYVISNLDYHLTEHCNLNCVGCSHFSNLANEEFADFGTFERDIEQISRIFNKNVLSFNLLGGEPLLHPDIEKFAIAARTALPESHIHIITNGILIPKMPDSFWATCNSNKIQVHITHFPIKINTDILLKKAKEFDVIISYKENPEYWSKVVLNIEGTCNPKEMFHNCVEDTNCPRIYKGRLYPCTIIGNVEHFNKKFGTNLMHAEEDSLDIYTINNAEEILDWMSKAKPFCRFCDMKNWHKIKWRVSTKTMDEYLLNSP